MSEPGSAHEKMSAGSRHIMRSLYRACASSIHYFLVQGYVTVRHRPACMPGDDELSTVIPQFPGHVFVGEQAGHFIGQILNV